jgi:hypothetical protein
VKRKANLPIPNFDDLVRRYAEGEGEPVARLAKEAGVSYALLRLRFIDAGVWRSWTKHPANLTDQLPVEEIVRGYRDEQKTIPQIVEELQARDLPASWARVAGVLEKAGVPRDAGRRRQDASPRPKAAKGEYRARIAGKEQSLVQRFLGGESMRSICEEVGVPIWILPRLLKDSGYLPDVDLRNFQRKEGSK